VPAFDRKSDAEIQESVVDVSRTPLRKLRQTRSLEVLKADLAPTNKPAHLRPPIATWNLVCCIRRAWAEAGPDFGPCMPQAAHYPASATGGVQPQAVSERRKQHGTHGEGQRCKATEGEACGECGKHKTNFTGPQWGGGNSCIGRSATPCGRHGKKCRSSV